jgi:multiple sugar transport system permease protein
MGTSLTTERAAGPVPGGRGKGAGRRPRSARRTRMVPYLFLAPFACVFAGFLVVPLGYALYLSLFRSRLIGGQVFAGVANYDQAVHDPAFYSGLGRMALFFVMQVPVMLGLALIFALILDSGALYIRRLFRLGFFLPYAIPSVVAALMWGYLYGPTFGPIDQLANSLRLHAPNLLSSSAMLPSIANVVTWEYTGYNMIILFAALQAVPAELRDAAAVDGTGPVQIALRVKIPLIRSALVLTTVFSIIGTLQLFNEPQIMSTLAPSVIGNSYTPNLYAYNLAFTNQQYEYSAAISFLLGVVVFAGSYAFMWSVSRRARRAS